MKRLRDRHGVGRLCVERERLRRTVERFGTRRRRDERRPHLRDRLHRDDARAARDEQARQLARAGADVHDRRPSTDAAALDGPLDRLGRVRRPRALVELGGRAEPGRRDGMDARHYDGVTRYASNTASRLRSDVSSVRRLFRSPTSAVYRFFASWSSTTPP